LHSKIEEEGKMKKKGFTIMELLVVILVIGMLSGMTAFSYRKLFKKSRLEESLNEVRAFYEGVNRKAVTEGYRYILQIDRDNELLRSVSTETLKRDSLVLREGLDLDFVGGEDTVRLTVHVDGFVRDDDNVRELFLIDKDLGDTIEIYISPLGVMEASLK
jgi:prepilin-type N-terminal cleavage/methylation domain-containing protein